MCERVCVRERERKRIRTGKREKKRMPYKLKSDIKGTQSRREDE